MLKFDLKNVMQAYEAKTGLHLTYEELAQMTSISSDTLKSIATRPEYNATLKMISEIATALNIDPTKYFEWKMDKNGKE
ncbi:MAG: hypothetical protein ISR65_15000 [Bacteriovoracaceae bacterium]|nr:hypothetical protein [Bacteriovoracaceae bacterium]